jgi:hypothetical protein
MTGPRLSTAVREKGSSLFRVVELIGTGISLMLAFLLASGWKIEKPSQQIAKSEIDITALAVRVTAIEQNYTNLRKDVQTLIRMQCLAFSRREADLAGTCEQYPTREESSRTRRP